VAFGEKLTIPEIVALGGQSDGKNSLLEAILGSRFNVREVEMGSRRPLILQMVYDPSALEPRCRFQVFFSLCPSFKWIAWDFGKDGKIMEIGFTYAVHVETIGF